MDAAGVSPSKGHWGNHPCRSALAMMIPRGNRIAVVDDDDDVRRALARLLRADGFEPVLFPSAESLLRCDHPEAFQCAILAIRLDRMPGLRPPPRLRRTSPRV